MLQSPGQRCLRLWLKDESHSTLRKLFLAFIYISTSDYVLPTSFGRKKYKTLCPCVPDGRIFGPRVLNTRSTQKSASQNPKAGKRPRKI